MTELVAKLIYDKLTDKERKEIALKLAEIMMTLSE